MDTKLYQNENPETAWIDESGNPLPGIKIDPEYVKSLEQEEAYKAYLSECEINDVEAFTFEVWTKYKQYSSDIQAMIKSGAFDTNTKKLEQRISLLEEHIRVVDAENKRLVEQGLARDEELRKIVSDRDELAVTIGLVNTEICELQAKYDSKENHSYSDEDYENLLAIRDSLAEENEALIAEIEGNEYRNSRLRTPSNQPLFPHYFRAVPNATHVDVYWVLKAWDVTDPCVQHAVKKLLCLGKRGIKSNLQDLQEALDSIVRSKELEELGNL